jgi:hypothetical protein
MCVVACPHVILCLDELNWRQPKLLEAIVSLHSGCLSMEVSLLSKIDYRCSIVDAHEFHTHVACLNLSAHMCSK